ncbi:glycosyl hydrolase [Parapedobacter sp. DT-150]|uniref:glycosyl hydrolase n=1 Tax=Parapedobacter sp. DT-150 TaxID=3396162 RepID=UPI003F1C797A
MNISLKPMTRKILAVAACCGLLLYACSKKLAIVPVSKPGFAAGSLEAGFLNPPDSARPGVYWYFMDGNLSEESITKDLESMKKAGIGNALFLEVNVGVPRGPVDFLSDKWKDIFKHTIREAERLGIEITLGTGPGWTGSGGPWVTGAQSMQHLVSSTVQVNGPGNKEIILPRPLPRKPYFGEATLTADLKKKWDDFYEDVAVLAFPSPSDDTKIDDIDGKALYYRAPYTSVKGVKPFLDAPAEFRPIPPAASIKKNTIVDLTAKLRSDGTLNWKVPPGKWTVMRFGSRNNGAITRPAPIPGLGFEADKFDTVSMRAHLDAYTGKIFERIGGLKESGSGGLKRLQIDSWEMGAQNWTQKFREEFKKRRGYDPLPYYPVYAGNIVGNLELSERFLWDLRQTSQELILENHAGYLKTYSHRNGLQLTIEPYDMNPTADLELGAVADVAMCEFWSKDFAHPSAFSCIEASSIAHVNGNTLVPAEAFTAQAKEGWQQFPGSMKSQGDWAFAMGVNRFVYHTYQHQYMDDKYKPGMTMGPYGVHWDRGQTWWPMVGEYHRYIARCQYLLQQGRTVAEILYLTPEGAPHVFRPPSSALEGEGIIIDKKGYSFDGCAPGQLYKATVKDNRIVFPSGASYGVMVMPIFETMNPKLLNKIRSLIQDGATVIGIPPKRAPGLSGYPQSDAEISRLAMELWGSTEIPSAITTRVFGKGKLIWGGRSTAVADETLYPSYESTGSVLAGLKIREDFSSSGPIRYTHRTTNNYEIYFVANKTGEKQNTFCTFNTTVAEPELWDAVTGDMRKLPQFSKIGMQTRVPITFEPHQSFFVIFRKSGSGVAATAKENFPSKRLIGALNGSWTVSFDTNMGGPAEATFDKLSDWSLHSEEGIKYYSGIAVYRQQFDVPAGTTMNGSRIYLDLGKVNNVARVRLNGKELGVLWTSPLQVEISSAVRKRDNLLEIEVANLWPNRLIGDEQLPYDGIVKMQWPEWYVKNEKRPTNRYTFTTWRHYNKNSPLLSSGLLGPVTLYVE